MPTWNERGISTQARQSRRQTGEGSRSHGCFFCVTEGGEEVEVDEDEENVVLLCLSAVRLHNTRSLGEMRHRLIWVDGRDGRCYSHRRLKVV